MIIGRRTVLVVVSMVFLLMANRSAAQDATATIKGAVTLEGKPLTGRIFVYLGDDQFVGAKIKDGVFHVARVPPGNWTVGIEGESVPARYRSEETSALKISVVKGPNEIQFRLVN